MWASDVDVIFYLNGFLSYLLGYINYCPVQLHINGHIVYNIVIYSHTYHKVQMISTDQYVCVWKSEKYVVYDHSTYKFEPSLDRINPHLIKCFI